MPVALTIAGFDGSGGAGALADCRTFQRMGVYGVSALTAVVAQVPGRVSGFEVVEEPLFKAQLEDLARCFPISAAKTGMLASEGMVEIASEFLKEHLKIRLVIDPVLAASAGRELTGSRVLNLMCEKLFSRAELVTPNLSEAETILDREIRNLNEQKEAATRLFERFGGAWLVKGGHLENDDGTVADVLCVNGEIEILSAPKLLVPDLHGTGCTLSAAITAGLANGESTREAVLQARVRLRHWMENYHTWELGGETHAINAID